MQIHWWIYIGPVAGALLGLIVVWVIRWFVFYPLREIRLGPLRLHGIIWKQRPLLTKEIAATAAGFIDIDALGATITAPASVEKILPQAEAKIDEFLRVRLVKAMPVVGMFVGDKTINQLKLLFVQELKELFPEIMRGYLSGLQQDFDIKLLLERKLGEIPQDEVLCLFITGTKKIWHYAFFAGAAIGLASGLLQVFLFYMAVRSH